MKHYLLTLTTLWLACGLMAAPAHAQDGCGCGEDDDAVLEDEDGCGCAELEEEWEETGRNSAGQKKYKKNDGSDEGAPKLKRDLQTRVNEAIEKGVEWLKKKQRPDGWWGPTRGNQTYGGEKGDFKNHFSGVTTFSVFTLSKCGVKKSDKHIKLAYQWLHKHYRQSQIWNSRAPSKAKGQRQLGGHMDTYDCSSFVMMLEAMHQRSSKLTSRRKKRPLHTSNPYKPPVGSKIPKDDWRWMNECIIFLTKGKPGGGRKSRSFKGCQNVNGGWRYGQANGDQDMSATQFVLLGLRAASQAGYPVKEKVWLDALAGVRKNRVSGGGYCYHKGEGANAGMDACSVASMVICREQLRKLGAAVPAWVDGDIARGLKHLDSIFDISQNRGFHKNSSNHYYFLYSIERLGDLTHRKEFGGKDWYVRGAEFLLANQRQDGSWTDTTCQLRPKDTLGTCFALLFLKKATIPAVTLSE